MQRGIEQTITRVESFAGKVHLGDQAFETAVEFEMNVRRSGPILTGGIGPRLHCFDAVKAVAVGSDADGADEIWIQRRRIVIIDVGVPAETVGLPDRNRYAANRF